ncbi:hypothetical protein LXL04_004527 [Taraxacum kok-saghyz]
MPPEEPQPAQVLQRRTSPDQQPQLLIQWNNQDAASATWENAHEIRLRFPEFQVELEDELSFETEGVDTIQETEHDPPAKTKPGPTRIQPRRNTQLPIRLRD